MAVRTCVGCRRTASKSELLRFTKDEAGALILDVSGRAPRRGAYVCLSADCVLQALKKGGFSRAFRSPLQYVDLRDQARRIAEHLYKASKGVLSRGCRGEAPCSLGAPWGEAPSEMLAWRVAGWLRFAQELEASPAQQSKKQGRSVSPTQQTTQGSTSKP